MLCCKIIGCDFILQEPGGTSGDCSDQLDFSVIQVPKLLCKQGFDFVHDDFTHVKEGFGEFFCIILSFSVVSVYTEGQKEFTILLNHSS